jgi:ATP-binding cassette subfamily C exporter for protease/lipase
MMIAATILLGKALSPLEAVIGSWRQWRSMLSAYERLNTLFRQNPVHEPKMRLPKPKGYIAMDHVFACAPGSDKFILKDVSFAIGPGDVLGVIGPSAAGKSTLARVALGIWPAIKSSSRLDGADIYSWNKEELGPALGFVPQEIEIFPGTVSENIARVSDYQPEDVVQAAQLAGIHEMILLLPNGYNTVVGDGGLILSGGQKQRLALARAAYGNPIFLVLDEPNSNLDDAGEDALRNAIHAFQKREATVMLITHRLALLQMTNKLLYLQDGVVRLFGSTEQVLRDLQNPVTQGLAAAEVRGKA